LVTSATTNQRIPQRQENVNLPPTKRPVSSAVCRFLNISNPRSGENEPLLIDRKISSDRPENIEATLERWTLQKNFHGVGSKTSIAAF
jgi:hypothetical protein